MSSTTGMPRPKAPGVVTRLVLLVIVAGATGILLGALFLPAALATNDVIAAVRSDVLDFPPLGEADAPPQNSYVYAADGSELAELTFEENRVPVQLDDIPQHTIDAVLATEDANFYEHEGVNHRAIVRAALTNLQAGGIESGASTITQQYVKLAFLSPEQTMQRKIEEAVYALELEARLSKDEILERYLNRSYFGSGVYGIGTAAERYFSKDISQLTVGESAMLAGLLRSPERNNPIASMDNAQARRNIVLSQMVTHGFIDRATADTAASEPLEINISEIPPPDYPFWVDWVSRLLVNEDVASALGSQVDALDTMGATFEERRRTVFQSGLRIHTTLDPELQAEAETALLDHLTAEDETPQELAQEPMGALVSVEPGTGAIVTMAIGPHAYGGCDEDNSWVGQDEDGRLLCDRTKVNPAVPGQGGRFGRQPGSAFKPFLTAAALEEGLPPSLTLDARGPAEIEGCRDGTDAWTVRNTGGDGILDMYEATARSSNVYHAMLIAEIGPEKLVDMSRRLGITSPYIEAECALSLGAGSVFPLEMATAYATLANRGVHCAPFPITRIEDAQGTVIWEHTPDCEQVIDTDVADRVVDLLAGPVSSGGTAPNANLAPYPTRGKTGTTNDNVDVWFVGFTRQMATASWIGFPNGTSRFATLEQAQQVCPTVTDEEGNQVPVSEPACLETRYLSDVRVAGQYYPQVYGGTIPAPMWHQYMQHVVARYEPEEFPDPGPLPTGRVPDLTAVSSVSDAERLAEEAGFRVVVTDVSDWRRAGTFVGQEPRPGRESPLGIRITLERSDGTGQAPTVPDVSGLTADEAAEELWDAGYRVFRRNVDVDDPLLDERVVSMSPSAGSRLEPDGNARVTIDVGVYTEPDEEPDPPDGDAETDDEPEAGGDADDESESG